MSDPVQLIELIPMLALVVVTEAAARSAIDALPALARPDATLGWQCVRLQASRELIGGWWWWWPAAR